MDIGGELQDAGGIGGLLALKVLLNGTRFVAYDGNGNVAGLVKGSDGTVSALYEYDPFLREIRATEAAPMTANPWRASSKYFDRETKLVYFSHRYYSASMGKWLSRDPIEEVGGNNVYSFVGNDAIDGIDPIGDDFIAVGGLSVLGIGVHMSLEFYTTGCGTDPDEGLRFTSPPPEGARLDSGIELWDVSHYYKHEYTVPLKGGGFRKVSDPISISFIRKSATAERRYVLFSDAQNGKGSGASHWKQILTAADSYAYAESTDGTHPPLVLKRWPNSWYSVFGNNSNTFIRQMANVIGRDPDVIGGGIIPGNREPRRVPNPGWTPIFSPTQ